MLIGATILVHLILTPLAYTKNLEPTTGQQYTPLTLSEDAYIINEVNNYKILNDIKINSILSRHLRDFQRLLKRALDITLQPILAYAILLIYTLTYFKKLQQKKSILAFSLGGHAPPVQ
jgi:hypothetical protein